ncbi:hypothetical protein HU200_051837 [Digitaria exilis]|uniref:X8 domain-containing protein n=1 Tax=Digitaria exilis TaxID=1010633 RepID=A0A835AJP5_9POAL|nr:hypothetical protein HU200_051837 [Digitaria exilis]
MQKTIDYACGAGADCNAIHENGQCYNPNNVPAHCSWAANSYYQNNKAKGATCDFTGTAALTTSDPIIGLVLEKAILVYWPSFRESASVQVLLDALTLQVQGTMGGTPGTLTPGTGTTGTGMGTGTTAGTTGTGFGLGPGTGAGMDTAAASLLPRSGVAAVLTVLLSSIAFA